ncbi:FAD-dependent monooxygenase [Pseudenhygromyxa sp. WMMC2535]|nr:FAD-dependent monooxygenase [Pseudenhygromyxa sp. WMMC2535]
MGAGIAGLCLALRLRAAGVPHLVLARQERVRACSLAETLPPTTLALLEREGLLELFFAHGRKTFGYCAQWGTGPLRRVDFFGQGRYGHGLKVDKAGLIHQLTEIVGDRVVTLNQIVGIEPRRGRVRISWAQRGREMSADAALLVDATGRRRAVLRRLNVPSLVQDHQVASSCHVEGVRIPELCHGVVTESFAGGWGIASALDETTNVLTLFAERGSPVALAMRDLGRWSELLADTRLLGRLLAPARAPTQGAVGALANSSRASQLCGPGWLAVGDAAIAFDPLSSHGISNAVFSASVAASAIEVWYTTGDTTLVARYAGRMETIFAQYLAQRRQYHRSASS